jgi:ribosomal protein S18 acetylase RimI-like enzyme
LNHELGTIGMLVVEPGADTQDVEDGLIAHSEAYLRANGAKVLYAGGQLPLNPFYWGVYGGSECAGILSTHEAFRRAAERAGYEPVSSTVLMEADLTAPEFRDPRAPLLRRLTRLEMTEDPLPSTWWEALAIGNFRSVRFRLVSKIGDRVLGTTTAWDMNWFGRRDARSRMGLIAMDVDPEHRRKGYGRHLVAEVLRQARLDMVSSAAVQTRATNAPALALYKSLGFLPVGSSTLYRLPADRPPRRL